LTNLLMRWIPFILFLYFAAVLQTAIVPFFAVHGIRPQLIILIAAYYALSARTSDALLACWCAGFMMDLTSIGFERQAGIGLNATTCGLIALFVLGMRDFMFRDSPVTQLVVSVAFTFLHAAAVGLYLCYAAAHAPAVTDMLLGSLYTAIYTGLVAPYVHWLLRKMRNTLGLGVLGRIRVR
jgi:rod shape-determining protein MreD